jgi:predicted  nucleic acid-binding Zn-ribbon protein
MEFRDYAATEASALITRLLKRQTEGSHQAMRRLREALDAAGAALEAATPDVDKEIQELVGRLVNAAGAVVKRERDEAKRVLDSVRGELNAERTEKGKLASSLSQLEGQIKDVSAKLGQEKDRAESAQRDLAAAREAQKQAEAARSKAETAAQQEAKARVSLDKDLRSTRELLDAEKAGTSAMKNELVSAQKAVDAAQAKAKEAAAQQASAKAAIERELQESRASLDAALADTGRLGKQLEASAAEKGKLHSELSARQGELQTATEQRDAIAAQLKAATARLQTLERNQAGNDDRVKQAEAKLKELQKSEAALREQAAGREKSDAALREQTAKGEKETAAAQAKIAALTAEAGRARSLVETCLKGIDELAGASTIAALLTALSKQLASQFPRVALFRVKGNRLEGEQNVGFDQKDVTKLVIPLNMDSMITRVVASGAVESAIGPAIEEAGGPPLGGAPAIAIALPIVIQGETIAVVYADDAGQKGPARDKESYVASVGFAKLMLKQTGVLLMRLTHELKTLTELRNYATMLLQEAEQMYGGDADAGRSAEERRSRLKDTLDCARQLYAQRAALEGDAAVGLLDDQITAIAKAQATPFAKDLAALIGQPAAAGRRSATAS